MGEEHARSTEIGTVRFSRATTAKFGSLLIDGALTLSAQGIEHSGIAYCHRKKRSLGEIIASLVLIWEMLESDEMRSRVEFIDEALAYAAWRLQEREEALSAA